MMNLDKVRIGFSPLSGQCFIYRHGKDARIALDKREATAEVQTAIVRLMMHDAPKGASQQVKLGDEWFEISVMPCQRPDRCVHCSQPHRLHDNEASLCPDGSGSTFEGREGDELEEAPNTNDDPSSLAR